MRVGDFFGLWRFWGSRLVRIDDHGLIGKRGECVEKVVLSGALRFEMMVDEKKC